MMSAENVKRIGQIVLWAMTTTLLFACDTDDNSPDAEVGTDTDTAFTDTDTQSGDTGFVTDAGIAYPGDDWPSKDPESAGFSSDALEEAALLAEEENTHCLMVVHKGYVVGQWYFDDWTDKTVQNVFSVTKSITSVAVGIAEDLGYLDVDDSASLYISDWWGTAGEAVTVEHLLSNTSGRAWDFFSDYVTLGLESDKTGYAVGLEQAETPGAEWEYNNTAVQTLDRVMAEATGTPLSEFAREHLFSPIGMSSTYSSDDTQNTIAFSDVRASCSDLARFGYLVLRNGRWGDLQVVSEEFLDEALSPSSELNSAYGYLFWLNRDGHWVKPSKSDTEKPEGDGRLHSDLPEDLVSAEGFQNQLAVISPEDDIVIARIGGSEDALSAYLTGNFGSQEFVEELIYRILDAKNE